MEAQPLIVKYFRTGIAKPVDIPLDTVTTKGRFGLAEPYLVKVGGKNLLQIGPNLFLGIRFRMLQDYELAAAHGFPKDFQWTKKKSTNVKLVGNSWPHETAKALCLQRLQQYVKTPKVPVELLAQESQKQAAYGD